MRKRSLQSSDADACRKRSSRTGDLLDVLLAHDTRLERGELFLDRRNLISVPQEIFNHTQITCLFLEWNKLETVPAELGLLTALHVLYLSDNRLTYLPSSISNLTNLRTLRLDGNLLTAFPRAIASLTALEILSLRHNKLRRICSTIGRMTGLHELSIDYNNIASLPKEIFHLPILTSLSLGNNKFTQLPDEACNLTALEKLNLDSANLVSVPPQIAHMTRLKDLWIGMNRISSLPQEIVEKLQCLQSIGIHCNKLTTLPSALFRLPQLDTIYAMENKFTFMPSTVRLAVRSVKMSIECLVCNKCERALGKELTLPYYDIPTADVQLFFSILPRDCNNTIDHYVNPPICIHHGCAE